MNSTRRLLLIVLALLILLGIVALIFFLMVRDRTQPVAEEKIERTSVSAEVISGTIEKFDPDDPSSFQDIQIIVDMGEGAVDPLIERASSDDLVDQWAVVVGLTSIRRTLSDQDEISATMREMYLNENESIRVYAAMSNAEQKDYSGVPIILKALESDGVMLYMDPPKPVSNFANLVLEFISGEDYGFDEAVSQEEKNSAITSWNSWWEEFKGQNV